MATEDRYDMQKVLSAAAQLEEMASELSHLSTEGCEETAQMARSAWSGAGADMFQAKLLLLQEKLQEASAVSREAADAYREAAAAAEKADAASAAQVSGKKG